jgi:hypothetical protein
VSLSTLPLFRSAMASTRTKKKRKKVAARFTPNKRLRAPQSSKTKAPRSQPRHSQASDAFWPPKRILQETATHYKVEWEQSWEPHSFVTSDLEVEWRRTVAAGQAAQETCESGFTCTLRSVGWCGCHAESAGEAHHPQGQAAVKSLIAIGNFPPS